MSMVASEELIPQKDIWPSFLQAMNLEKGVISY